MLPPLPHKRFKSAVFAVRIAIPPALLFVAKRFAPAGRFIDIAAFAALHVLSASVPALPALLAALGAPISPLILVVMAPAMEI